MDGNNVQTLDKKRGRPKSELITLMRGIYPEYTSRQSVYNALTLAAVGVIAVRLGLADQRFRDIATGKRLRTKLAAIGRVRDQDFFASEAGETWLRTNWSQIVELPLSNIQAWAKSEKQTKG